MQIEILGEGAFESVLVHLESGERFISESGALYRSSSNVTVDVTTRSRKSGGILGGLKRLLSSENFFFSTYELEHGSTGEVGLAPVHQGQVMVVEMDGDTEWMCAGGSYLGSTEGLDVDTEFQGFKGLFSGEAPIFLRVSGSGQLVVEAFGRLSEMDVHDGQELIVDTGHLVAYESSLQYTVSKAAKGWVQSWLSGEGLVLRFSGSGRIITQSHNPTEFGRGLGPLLPPRKS